MNNKKSNFISFLGGRNLLFSLIVLILIGILIFVYHQIAFIFKPVVIFFSAVIAPVILAVLLYFLFNPVIDWMEKHKIKRTWGVVLLFLSLLALIAGASSLAFPAISKQVTELVAEFPTYVDTVGNTVREWSEHSIFEEPIANAIDWFDGWVRELPSHAVDYIGTAMSGISNVVSKVSNFIIILATFPFILFFLLKDDRKFVHFLMKIVPPKFRKDVKSLIIVTSEQVGSYVKGQILVSMALGLMAFIGFKIIGLKYAGILAILTSFTSIIPFIGAALSMIIAAVVAVSTSWFMLLKLAIVWITVQFIDGNVTQPNIMGKNLNVHPITILIVLLVMGDLLGFVGLILGVPIYAVGKVLVTFVFRKFKKRYNLYYGEEAGYYTQTEFDLPSYQRKEEE